MCRDSGKALQRSGFGVGFEEWIGFEWTERRFEKHSSENNLNEGKVVKNSGVSEHCCWSVGSLGCGAFEHYAEEFGLYFCK